MIFHPYYKPRPKYFHSDEEVKGPRITKKSKSKKLYLGIELEVEFPRIQKTKIRKCVKETNSNWWYAKVDGSLKRGVEFVTHPLTADWLLTHKKEILDKLSTIKSYGAVAWKPGRAGIHIHMSKSAFTKKHLWNFQRLIYFYPEFTRKISGKTWDHLADWSDLLIEDVTDLKLKSKHKTNPIRLRDKMYKWYDDNNQTYSRPSEPDKYIAVNLMNKNTVEVRIFRSSLHPATFWRAIEYCIAAHDYTGQRQVATLYGFCAFVSQEKEKYPNLYRFLVRSKYLI